MYVCMRMYIQREGDSDIGNSETTASHKEAAMAQHSFYSMCMQDIDYSFPKVDIDYSSLSSYWCVHISG